MRAGSGRGDVAGREHFERSPKRVTEVQRNPGLSV